MTGLKRAIEQEFCPHCKSKVSTMLFDIDCFIEMCENEKCNYPFDEPDFEKFISNNKNDVGYGIKKRKTLTVANASLEKAAAKSVQSAKETFSPGLNPPSTSSSSKQKDQNKQDAIQETQTTQSDLQLPATTTDSSNSNNSNNNSNNNNYSLVDIENMLNSDDLYIDTESISESSVQTPKDILDAGLFDGLDGFLVSSDNTQSKYNPFQGGDSELDSLLGI